MSSGLALLTVGNGGKGSLSRRSVEPSSVTPGKSGLPSSRCVGNSGKAMCPARRQPREATDSARCVRLATKRACAERWVSARSRCPDFPSSSRRANDTGQAAVSRPLATLAAVAQRQSVGLSIRKMSVQARSAAPLLADAAQIGRRQAAGSDAPVRLPHCPIAQGLEHRSYTAEVAGSTPTRTTRVGHARGVQRFGFLSRLAHSRSHRTVCTERTVSTQPPRELAQRLEHQACNLTVASSTLAFPTAL